MLLEVKRKDGVVGTWGGVEEGVAVGFVGVCRGKRLEMGEGLKPRRRASCLASLRVRPSLKRSIATSASNL